MYTYVYCIEFYLYTNILLLMIPNQEYNNMPIIIIVIINNSNINNINKNNSTFKKIIEIIITQCDHGVKTIEQYSCYLLWHIGY